MEDIGKRLRESTEACIKNFDNWEKQNKSLETREELMETMHDVRKVLSRVEIEIAISERDRLGSRPLPIPPHRSSRKREGGDDSDSSGDDNFNMAEGQPSEPRRQQQSRGRRPMHSGGSNRNQGNPGNGDNQSQ